jgi:hypothetical protein
MKTVLTFGLALFALAGMAMADPWKEENGKGKRGGYGGYERHGG